MRGTLFHQPPELTQPFEPLVRRVTGDQGRIDGANGGADHPVRLDAALVQRVVDTPLVGAQGAAALKHKHHLARHATP